MTLLMGYERLKDKLDDVFRCSSLKQEEQLLLIMTYLTPGITLTSIDDGTNKYQPILQDLCHRGLLSIRERGGELQIYPIPLSLLLKKCEHQFLQGCLQQLTDVVRSIDKWIHYPVMRSDETQYKSTQENSTVIEWLFDLHITDWERVFCFGDYESFIRSIGHETESEWIRERIKRGRKASVVATQDGKWARHIHEKSQQQLRDCLIDPRDFEGLFIMAFPEVYTTVMGGKDDEVTFIHSTAVSHHYSNLVDQSLLLSA